MADSKALTAWKVDYDGLALVADKQGKLDPPGYDTLLARDPVVGSTSHTRRKDPNMLARKQQALFARAQSQFKQVGFMCFMMWMTGNGIQIFSIMMTTTGLTAPLYAIWKSAEAFPADPEGQLDTLMPRLLYCLIQLGQFLFAIWKLNGMGLLPTHASDWLSGTPPPPVLEHAYGALA